jgi:hypothetical protein
MKLSMQNIIILFLVAVFLAGFVVLLNNGVNNGSEDSNKINQCPNLLVRNGNRLSLLDSKKKEITSFDNLEGYKSYLEVQNKKGIHCPVLYIQEENNTQGTDMYKMYSDPFTLEPGLMTIPLSSIYGIESMENESQPIPVLDANRQNSPYNANNYPGFDPNGLNVGQYTTVDAVHDSTQLEKKNDNAMDPNWQGVLKSQESVATGKYIENQVDKVAYPNFQHP